MSSKKSTQSVQGLKAWREAHGLTQRDAGARFGISESGWCRLENGNRSPRKYLAKRLMSGTGVALEVLMGIAS